MSLLEMTPKGALERIVKIPVRPAPDNSLDLVAMITAKKALQKQIPQKPIPEGQDEQDYILCPCCKNPVGAVDDYLGKNKLNKFCHNCGQALDWSS
jgi:hypothetical protein